MCVSTNRCLETLPQVPSVPREAKQQPALVSPAPSPHGPTCCPRSPTDAPPPVARWLPRPATHLAAPCPEASTLASASLPCAAAGKRYRPETLVYAALAHLFLQTPLGSRVTSVSAFLCPQGACSGRIRHGLITVACSASFLAFLSLLKDCSSRLSPTRAVRAYGFWSIASRVRHCGVTQAPLAPLLCAHLSTRPWEPLISLPSPQVCLGGWNLSGWSFQIRVWLPSLPRVTFPPPSFHS